jgi:hypothetical protein
LLRGFIGLFGAFLCHVLIGAINRWSLINPYITSFYKITTDPHLEIKKNGFMMPLNMLSIGLTMKWGFHQCKEYGPIKIMIISVLGMALSIWMASFVDEFICNLVIKLRVLFAQQCFVWSVWWHDILDSNAIVPCVFS